MGSSATRSSRPDKVPSSTLGEEMLPLEFAELGGVHLGAAAARLLEQPPPDLAGLRREHFLPHLQWLLLGEREGARSVAEHGATLMLRRRIIEVLRAELLEMWRDCAPAPDEIIETLLMLERAREACTFKHEEAFAAELADRGGLDLIVEVAHDMRSPLTSILFLSEILHSGQSGSLSDVQKRQVGIIYGAALGLVGMASDMIEVARGGNQLSDGTASPFSIDEVLRAVRDLVAPTAEEKGLKLQTVSTVPPNRVGHPIPLSRVLLNLTTNALRFTHEGFVEVSARVVSGTVVEFAVRDTGPGIPAEAMTTLFQPFKREPARESGYVFSGTGLGLAICRRLVAALGSKLEIETDHAWGTRFSFRLDLPPASLI
jgi:signal transduction histidine kinase